MRSLANRMAGAAVTLLVSFLVVDSSYSNAPWNHALKDVAAQPRVNIVHVDTSVDATYYHFLCAIPMAVYHHGDQVYTSLLLSDDLSDSTNVHLLNDWNGYLDAHSAQRHANFIGDVDPAARAEILSRFGLNEFFEWDTISGNPVDVADRIALKDWQYTKTVVVVPYTTPFDDDGVESVSNGAIIASLVNGPLLLSFPESLSTSTLDAISDLGADEAILVEIGDVLSSAVDDQLDSLGVEIVEDLRSESGIVTSVREKAGNSTLCGVLDRWQSLPGTYLGARYGGYLLFLPDTLTDASRALWEKIADDPDLQRAEKFEELPGSKDWLSLEEDSIAHVFYNWLSSIGGNDPDSLETVITFEPQGSAGGQLETTFERAITGDPSDLSRNGAVAGRMPLSWQRNIALANRTAVYRAVVFGNPRPTHVTLSLNAYEVRYQVDTGSPVPDSWGSNHVVNEIFGWPYRGWTAENGYFPWDDIALDPPDLLPVLPPGDGDGADHDPGSYTSFLSAGYEVAFHNGAHTGTGSHPSQPGVENIGFLSDAEMGTAFLYFSCHGGGDAISVPALDGGIAEDLTFGDPYWPALDGRVNYSPGTYSQEELDEDLHNVRGAMVGFNACHMATGLMNEIFLEHGGSASISSYTAVSFTGSAWWWNLFTYLLAHDAYTVGEAATYATARSSNLFVPSKTSDPTLRYVVYGDPNCPLVATGWENPSPAPIDTDYEGHRPDAVPNRFAGSVEPDTIQVETSAEVVVTLTDTLGNPVDSAEVTITGWGLFSQQTTGSDGIAVFHLTPPYGELLPVVGRKLTFDLFSDTIAVTGANPLPSADLSASVAQFSVIDTLVPNYEGIISAEIEGADFTLHVKGAGIDTSTWTTDSLVDLAVTPSTEGVVTASIGKDGFELYIEEFPVLLLFGNLSGVVVESSTGDSLADVSVTGYEAGADTSLEQPVFQVVTDSSGVYTVPFDLPVGLYDLYTHRFEYLPSDDLVPVGKGANVFNVLLADAPSGMVQGLVSDEETQSPLSGFVQVYRTDNAELYAEATVESISGGQYLLELPYFEYDFRVSATRHVPATRRVLVQADTLTEDFPLSTTVANLLLVDATSSKPAENRERGVGEIVDDLLHLGYHVTEESYDATLPGSWLLYDILIVSTGNNPRDVSGEMKDALVEYVEDSSNVLLIEGGDIGYHNRDGSLFQEEVLNIGDQHIGDDGDQLLVSDSSHPIVSFPNLLPSTIEFEYENWLSSDVLEPAHDAQAALVWSVTGSHAGVIHTDTQIVFFTFDYSGIIDSTERRGLLQNSLHYLFTHRGHVGGTVRDAATMEEVEGAVVQIGDWSDTTDSQGQYLIECVSAVHDVAVVAYGYNSDTTTGVRVLPACTTRIDFALAHPEIEVVPDGFQLQLREGLLDDTTLVMENDGNGLLSWQIAIHESREAGKSTNRERLFRVTAEARDAPEWLSVEPPVGSLPPGEADTVTLHLNAGGLLPETTYTATVSILNNSIDDSVEIDVVLDVLLAPRFVRGDPDGDGTPTMADAVHVMKFVYLPGYPPPPCIDGGDVNDSGDLNMADAIYLLKHLYIPGSPTPPPPFDECGRDPTVDEIDCVSHPCMDSVRTDGLRRIRTDKLDRKILPENQLQKERGNR